MKIIQDLKEFIELLNLEGVLYLVIGGWAYNRYAEPRFTGDIDLFVDASLENEALLRNVLSKFGFGSALPPSEHSLFTKPVIMLGRPPNRIDIISQVDGLQFSQAWQNRESGDLDGLPVSFISLADLIINKKASGRDKDILDLKTLERLYVNG